MENTSSPNPSAPKVTVVIPVKNGGPTLESCLRGIFGQRSAPPFEVLVIDSGSTDNTLEVLARFPVRLHQIPGHEFNHGVTRNLSVTLARGEIIIMTVQDATPVGDGWLASLVEHFADERVVGVCGQETVSHEADKNPAYWFRPYSAPQVRRVSFRDRNEFEKLPPGQQMAAAAWNNVTAAYRRSILKQIPFPRVTFGEDFFWAKEALAAGHVLVYDPRARVAHYHQEYFSYRFRRKITEMYFAYRCFGVPLRPARFFYSFARAAYVTVRTKELSITCRLKWVGRNLWLLLAEWLASVYVVYGGWRGERRLDQMHTKWCGKSLGIVRETREPASPEAGPAISRG